MTHPSNKDDISMEEYIKRIKAKGYYKNSKKQNDEEVERLRGSGMNNRYALIQYNDDVADYAIHDELAQISLGRLRTFETIEEALERFDEVLENFGYKPVETPTRYGDWQRVASDCIEHSSASSKSESRARMAVIRLLGVTALAQIDQAMSATLNNEIMAGFLEPAENENIM